jgi:putative tryptophan/tyrosine transport system substrate-binding protein
MIIGVRHWRLCNRKTASLLGLGFDLFALLLVFCASAGAQQPAKITRIGYLDGPARSSVAARTNAFRQGMRDLGYVEGKNISFEYRFAEGRIDRLPALAAELVRLKVEVIVTGGAAVTRAAKDATVTIPIVMAQDPDPVGNGFVASLARPGGNITGLSSLTADLSGKGLELLKEILPKLGRVAVIGTSTNAATAQQLKETEAAARALAVQLQFHDVRERNDLQAAFRAAIKAHADALFPLGSPVLMSYRRQIIDLAASNGLPALYNRAEYVEDGGLMSYGMSINDLARRAATYVDKILKGAKPAELPVERPTKFELVINLNAAKQIGLTIPPNVLARANRIIK